MRVQGLEGAPHGLVPREEVGHQTLGVPLQHLAQGLELHVHARDLEPRQHVRGDVVERRPSVRNLVMVMNAIMNAVVVMRYTLHPTPYTDTPFWWSSAAAAFITCPHPSFRISGLFRS